MYFYIDDIQCEIQESKFLSFSITLMVNFSKNNIIIYALISIFRRISDNEFIAKLSKELLYTFVALLDYYYVSVKEKSMSNQREILLNFKDSEKDKSKESTDLTLNNKNNIITINKEAKSTLLDLTILKEITALLGNLMTIEENIKIFFEKSLHLVLIDNIISFINYPKIVKICIGVLVNLTAKEEIRDSLGNVAAFIQSLRLIFEKYKDNMAIMDYLLKLLLNSIKNRKILF